MKYQNIYWLIHFMVKWIGQFTIIYSFFLAQFVIVLLDIYIRSYHSMSTFLFPTFDIFIWISCVVELNFRWFFFLNIYSNCVLLRAIERMFCHFTLLKVRNKRCLFIYFFGFFCLFRFIKHFQLFLQHLQIDELMKSMAYLFQLNTLQISMFNSCLYLCGWLFI